VRLTTAPLLNPKTPGGHLSIPFGYQQLKETLEGATTAFRSLTRLQPAGGNLDKVFPPTYKDATYAVEQRHIPGREGTVPCVLLDSVQSQANRFEPALLELRESGQITLPTIRLDFSEAKLPRNIELTSLEVPHRISDALLRDSFLGKERFRDSPVGKVLDDSDLKNATGLFRYCPTALLFGLWDSTGPRGGLGVKFQRALVSEIVGFNFVQGVRTSSRIDPTQIVLKAGPLYDDGKGSYVLDLNQAARDKEKNKPILLKKTGKPSEANLGNVTPSCASGGVSIEFAQQTSVISLPALRRLRFPVNGKTDPKVNTAARCVLAALGLLSVTVTQEQGYDLRSRCLLVAEEALHWELIGAPGSSPVHFSWTSGDAIALFNEAVDQAKKLGLPWEEKTVELTPAPQLAELVRRSQLQLLSSLEVDEI
jgi:CRISPR-associated protein Csb1